MSSASSGLMMILGIVGCGVRKKAPSDNLVVEFWAARSAKLGASVFGERPPLVIAWHSTHQPRTNAKPCALLAFAAAVCSERRVLTNTKLNLVRLHMVPIHSPSHPADHL